MAYINNILSESTLTQDNSVGRPALLGLTRATTNLIYQDLVASQPTKQPVAALYGIKYLNPNNTLTFITPATYSGQYGTEDRTTITVIDMTNYTTFTKGDLFLLDDTVFKVLAVNPFVGTTSTNINDIVIEALALSTIRLAPEAAYTEKFEAADSDISDSRFIVNKWQANVKSRKFKTDLSVELAQDMEAAGFDTPNFLEDLLATQMAEEINKDIIQSLITVSARFKVSGVTDKGILDLSTITGDDPAIARTLYKYVCEMNAQIQRQTSYSGTYVVASTRCAAILAASGWLKYHDDQPEAAYGTLKNGLVVYFDTSSPIDYIVVGVKADYGDKEMVGSLFYAPYSEGIPSTSDDVDHVGAYKIINDPNSLQPKIMLLMRYALCVNPYTMPIDDAEARVIDCTDLDLFAGQSQMSSFLGIKLPKLV